MSTVLITGANRGLGLEFVRQYAADGWQVIAAARDPHKGKELNALVEANKNIELAAVDISNDASVAALKKKLAKRPIDILINNAGVYPEAHNEFGDVDYSAWLDTLNVNTLGPVRVTEALVDNLLAGERKLAVVITSTMGSITTYLEEPQGPAAIQYRSSKTAVNMAVTTIARALRKRRITVIAQCPGWVQTDMGGKGATLKPSQSISAMRKIFDRVTLNESGQFINHHGDNVPW